MPPDTLRINEIFFSVQGESTRAGLPCVFVRLTGCHLRCDYCDTEYAFHEGENQSLDAIIDRVQNIAPQCKLVQITGGEPLLQPGALPLMSRLADLGYTVMLETSGACDIAPVDERVAIIMDLKTPGSGEVDRNLLANIEHLRQKDELKFVLTSREDYDWMKDLLTEHNLADRVGEVLVSAVHTTPPGKELPGAEGLSIRELTEWVLADHLPVRVQTQLHKIIWDPAQRGV
jgi:7-carboxy-7-deazaguanine synthase